MKRLVVWTMICALLLSAFSGLAESSVSATLAPEGVVTEVETLKYGDEGEAVAQLQSRLTQLYYYTGNISGRYREGTQTAIKSFQSDFGLEATGIADPETQTALYAARYRPLEKGDSGEDVKALQTRLTELGYYNGKLSGNYLDGSYYGISNFQEKNGLKVTGKADVETQAHLFDEERALAKKQATPTPTPPPTPTPGLFVGDVVVEEGTVIPTPAPTANAFTKKLQRGSTGEKVKQLQARLTDLGFYEGPISGNFLSKTKDAVTKFQKHNGITADGVAGEATWNLIFNSSEVVPASATPKPTPVPTPVPYAVTVDVNNQVVTVYGLDENSAYTKVVRQMICSTGTRSNPSDVGDWKLDGRTARWAYFPKWGSHAQYWTRINKYIAFHSVIYNSVNSRDLSVKSYNALGSRASHGCIRLLVSDAQWVYENIGKGTIVTITEKLPSDPELCQSLKPAALDRSVMLPKATPAPTPAPVYDAGAMPPMPFRTLDKGDNGVDVYWLQMKLKELGYYTGTVTGGYYGGTQAAVKAFQKANGLNADGVAGNATQSKLYESLLATPTIQPTSTPVPAEIPTATPSVLDMTVG